MQQVMVWRKRRRKAGREEGGKGERKKKHNIRSMEGQDEEGPTALHYQVSFNGLTIKEVPNGLIGHMPRALGAQKAPVCEC